MQIESLLDPGIMCRTMGGVPIICSFGNYHQLPAASMKIFHDVCAATYTDSSEFSGRLDLQYFMNIYPADDTYYTVFIMDKVVKQKDHKIWSFLKNMHQGTVIDYDVVFWTSSTERNIAPYDRDCFKDVLQRMP